MPATMDVATADLYTYIRWTCEVLTVICVVLQLAEIAILVKRIGTRSYRRTLTSFPARLVYTASFAGVLLTVPLRAMCYPQAEHIIATIIVIATTGHMLFFCRGIKFVGPVVIMIYKIVVGDMLRFFIIYLTFAIGFSQAFFVVFKSCHRGKNVTQYFANGTAEIVLDDGRVVFLHNIVNSATEALLRCFIMSIGEFAILYRDLNECRLHVAGKILFIAYELFVSIMLLNLLIAMMARTYDAITATGSEWKRQWAKVILMFEQMLTPRQRMLALVKYSRPIHTDKTKRAFVLKWHRSESETARYNKDRQRGLDTFREDKRAQLKRKNAGTSAGDNV